MAVFVARPRSNFHGVSGEDLSGFMNLFMTCDVNIPVQCPLLLVMEQGTTCARHAWITVLSVMFPRTVVPEGVESLVTRE